ncbi:MAG: hypothetical protein QJR01_09710 [Kyrpidia sp.]|nr:hypothetical protein [Kyrpidia sp.]
MNGRQIPDHPEHPGRGHLKGRGNRRLRGAGVVALAAALITAMTAPARAEDGPVHIRGEEVIAVPVDNELRVFDSFDVESPAGTPVSLHLPQGRRNVQVVTDMPASFTRTPDGISWPSGLPAGVHSVAITYSLPFENGRSDVEFTQTYDVDAVVLLIPEGKAALIAQGLFPATQVVELQGMKFRRFVKPDLFAGVPWTVTIQAIPRAGQAVSGGIPVPPGLPVIGAGYKYTELKALINLLLVIFVVTLGVIGLRRRRERLVGRLSDMHDRLIDQWAHLEVDRRRGAVPEEEYRRRRGTLLRRLLAVERQKRGMGYRD